MYPYLVGGLVRDILLEKPINHDYDISFVGDNLENLVLTFVNEYQISYSFHKKFNTYALYFKNCQFDFISTRKEFYVAHGNLPTTSYGNLMQDLYRRDFSVNAIGIALYQHHFGLVLDPLDGVSDCKNKIIRVIHTESFLDDPTRIFRAIRFSTRLNFKMDQTTSQLVKKSLQKNSLDWISRFRIKTEIEKIFLEKQVEKMLLTLEQLGVFQFIFAQFKMYSHVFSVYSSLHIASKNQMFAIGWSLLFLMTSIKTKDVIQHMTSFGFSLFSRKLVFLIYQIKDFYFSKKSIFTIRKNDYDIDMLKIILKYFRLFFDHISLFWLHELIHWISMPPVITGHDIQKLGYLKGEKISAIIHCVCVHQFYRDIKNHSGAVNLIRTKF